MNENFFFIIFFNFSIISLFCKNEKNECTLLNVWPHCWNVVHFNAYFFNNYAKTHKHIVPRTHAYILRIFFMRRVTQIHVKQICAIY